MVRAFREGKRKRSLVLRVWDTGGQPVFLSILQLLTAREGTVYLIVFNLAELHEAFDDAVDSIVAQLHSIQLYAAGAPVLLAGTRKDEVNGGSTATIRSLSARLHETLLRRCAPAISGLKRCDGLCFFAVENKRGYGGDETIRQLVRAIDSAAHGLPAVQRRMPQAWLRVHDELRRIGGTRRKINLDEAREICLSHGLPHEGLTIEQELPALLTFLHSLGFLLWYDTAALRSLVVLDPQWIVDAATCVIRDYKLKDHTEGYERMRAIDQVAIRQEPEAWAQLTEGRALLKRSLLYRHLWSGDDFREHKDELLQLLIDFSLAIPLPSNPSNEFLIPALLPPPQTNAPVPRGWAAVSEHTQMRIVFHLEGQLEAGKLLSDATELQHGYLPMSVFHRLSAAALGCSTMTKSGAEPTLDRHHAYVAFDDDALVTLTYMPSESSILVALTSDGRDGSAAAVADRMRVLLIEELSSFPNLRHRMLALIPGSGGHQYVDLDELPRADTNTVVTLRGERVNADALREEFAFWLTTRCDFNFVLAEKLRNATPSELPKMPSLQQLRRDKPDWVVRKPISLQGALAGEYVTNYLSLSYRWRAREHPDESGVQLRALQEHLKQPAQSKIEYVFVDYLCLAQGKEKTPKDKAEFKMMLPNINFLYLGTSVLILMFDRTYMERFWPLLEAWLSCMKGSERGLVSADDEALRCTIQCIDGLSESNAFDLKNRYRGCDANAVHRMLSANWVTVTNQSDKEVQLFKIRLLDFMARRTMKPAAVARLRPPNDDFLSQLDLVDANESSPRNSQRRRLDETLQGLIQGLTLGAGEADALRHASEWCEEQGVDGFEMIKEVGMEDDFVAALALKPGKQRQLRKRLGEMPGASSAAATAPH